MRKIWILILFLAISCQLSVVSGQQTSCMEDTIAQLSKSQYAKDLYMQAQNSWNSGHIVDACEKCFMVIEFIERDVKKRELDKSFYKPLAHAHYCIADIFINENYRNLGLMFQKKALYYFEKFENDSVLAHTNKFVGLAYIGTAIDTAKYYLNRCLELDPTNRFHKYDVDKAIAYMLYYIEDYKDSAFAILRNNLDEIEHDNVREAYHAFLGGIFIDRKEYDSALYHLEKSTESSDFWVRLDAINSLTILYDSIGDQEKKAYYESILSKLAFDRVDGEMERANIMDLYNEHLNRMHEIRKAKIIKIVLFLATPIIILIISLAIFFTHKNKKKNKNLMSIIDDKESAINVMEEHLKEKDDFITDVKFKNSIIEGKIKKKNAEIQKLTDHVKKMEREMADVNAKIGKEDSPYDVEAYCRSEICTKVLSMESHKLTQDDLVMLLDTANKHLNNVFVELSECYPRLKKEDLYYLCLVTIELSDKQISSLFGVAYNSIRVRRNKICEILGISDKKLNYFLSTKFK